MASTTTPTQLQSSPAINTPSAQRASSILTRILNKYPQYTQEKWQARILLEIEFVLSGFEHLPTVQALRVLASFSMYIASDNAIQKDIQSHASSESIRKFMSLWRSAGVHSKHGRTAFKQTKGASDELKKQMAILNQDNSSRDAKPIGLTLAQLCESNLEAQQYLAQIRKELMESSAYGQLLELITKETNRPSRGSPPVVDTQQRVSYAIDGASIASPLDDDIDTSLQDVIGAIQEELEAESNEAPTGDDISEVQDGRGSNYYETEDITTRSKGSTVTNVYGLYSDNT